MRSFARGRPVAVLMVLALVATVVSGCAGSDDRDPDDAGGRVTTAQAQQVLSERARALREHDLPGFLATLDRRDKALVVRQRRYFANMEALPLEVLRYTVLKSDWPAELRSASWDGDVALPQVRVATQLAGFDTVPVKRVTGFAIGRVGGKPVILSELTGARKAFPGSGPAPWDLVRIHVLDRDRILMLFDNDTVGEADEVGGVIRRGVAAIRDALPFSWDGKVVAYVFAKKSVLNSFEGVPGGNINHLGAMTFPMYSVLGQTAVAGIRFTLLPSSVKAGQPFLDRITRHELTHVAVGERDDGAPVWFAEGLAEYMGARSIAKDDRRIASVAVSRARAGVTSMPPSATFNGADQAWNYALAWMACDWIADTRGESALWRLMDALHAGGAGTADEDQDSVLREVIGIDSQELARRAVKRILRIYG